MSDAPVIAMERVFVLKESASAQEGLVLIVPSHFAPEILLALAMVHVKTKLCADVTRDGLVRIVALKDAR